MEINIISKIICSFALTEPVLHPIRTAFGSFFYIPMATNPRTIEEQISLLKSRGMIFKDEETASTYLNHISYYRLKGYWWDMQSDFENHQFEENTYFETVIDRYDFDRHLRLILFDAIERIEIALRTQMILQLSLSYGAYWYKNKELFTNEKLFVSNLKQLNKEFERSKEIFIKDHKSRYKNKSPESWKIMEVASFGVLSKMYKLLKPQLPEKSKIANELGLNSHKELSSWLEPIGYVRNIIAHHSRLWSRNMTKTPISKIKSNSFWFETLLTSVQIKKPFLIISTMIFICNKVSPNHHIKVRIIELINQNPNIPVYKLGFLNNWENSPLWKK